MRKLFTLGYPTLPAADMAFLHGFRNQHDERYRDVVAPHFTLVFACTSVAEDDYVRHVAAIAERCERIKFRCRYAMVGADDRDDTAYVFLVPDEGYSALSLLHDRLYTGILAPHLRLDIPYIPHMTIGTLEDGRSAKRLCDDLNSRPMDMEGSLDAITVGVLERSEMIDIASFAFRRRPGIGPQRGGRGLPL